MQNAKKIFLFLIVAFSIESIAQEANAVVDSAVNADNDVVEITSAQEDSNSATQATSISGDSLPTQVMPIDSNRKEDVPETGIELMNINGSDSSPVNQPVSQGRRKETSDSTIKTSSVRVSQTNDYPPQEPAQIIQSDSTKETESTSFISIINFILLLIIVVISGFVACFLVLGKLKDGSKKNENTSIKKNLNDSEKLNNISKRLESLSNGFSNLSASFFNLKENQSKFQSIENEISQVANLIITNQNQSHSDSCDIIQHFKVIADKIDSVSSSGLNSSLEKCSASINALKLQLSDLLQVSSPEIQRLNEQMEKLIKDSPDFVNFTIKSAVELVKQCQAEGLATPEQIEKTNAIAKKCREVQFESLQEIEDSKKYYDSRSTHAEEKESSRKQLIELTEKNNQLDRALLSLKQELKSTTDNNGLLNKTIATLKAQNEEMSKTIDEINADRNHLYQMMNFLCPDAVSIDSISHLFNGISPELKAETLVLIIQLYWFAQLFRNAPNKIKAAFTKFDETLYELYSEKQELLQSIRQSIQPLINNEVFKNTSYKVSWPALNSSASEHEDFYNRENDEGNRICKVRSAIITNAGNIESVARIYTCL